MEFYSQVSVVDPFLNYQFSWGSCPFVFFLFFVFLYTESKFDKGNLYNFSKLKKSRKWLKVRAKVECL